MKLYFVRHGQSEVQEKGLHQSAEARLSKIGRQQAKTVVKRLQDKNIELIFSSPFPRSKETAEIIAKKLDKKVEIREELRESAWPSEMVGLHHSTLKSEKIRKELENNVNDPDYKFSDEESYNELKERSEKFLSRLIDEHKDQNVLCVSHGLIQKVIVGVIVFEEEFNSRIYNKLKKNSWTDNTGITELEYTDEYGWTLHTWNDKTHL